MLNCVVVLSAVGENAIPAETTHQATELLSRFKIEPRSSKGHSYIDPPDHQGGITGSLYGYDAKTAGRDRRLQGAWACPPYGTGGKYGLPTYSPTLTAESPPNDEGTREAPPAEHLTLRRASVWTMECARR